MEKKESEGKSREMEFFYRRALLIHEFFVQDAQRLPVSPSLPEIKKIGAELNSQLKDVIEGAFLRNDLRGMKMINRDFDEIVSNYPESKRKELEARLAQAGLQ